MNEFDIIAKYFRPLAEGMAGAFALTDDAAAIEVAPGQELVLTCDALICGTHFLASDPIATVAKKLLRVNISDLAAKGARPLGYLLSCLWPKGSKEEMIAAFAEALKEDQAQFDLKLLGGDTTSGDCPLAFSLTALGLVPSGHMIRRAGAQSGDTLYVTGSIGDAHLGLLVATGKLKAASVQDHDYLVARHRLPQPRPAFMLAAREHIHAAIDVSDGLIADAGHLAGASGVAIEIDAPRLPLSDAASAWIASGGDILSLATGGDDYEVCLAAPPANAAALDAAARATGTRVTPIGRLKSGKGVRLMDGNGREIAVERPGFRHF